MSYLYNSRSSLAPKSTNTLDKCQKILRMFQQIGNSDIGEERDDDGYARRDFNSKNELYNLGLSFSKSKSKVAQNNPYYISQPSAKKYNSKPVINKSSTIYQSASKQTSKNNFNNSSSSSFFTNPTNHNQSTSKNNLYTNKNNR